MDQLYGFRMLAKTSGPRHLGTFWKSIPKSEIESIQKTFEKLARDQTGQISGNPFPINFEGELIPQ